MISVVYTMIGAATFGRISRAMIRLFDDPSDRDASMNSFSRSDSTWPRMMRAMYGQLNRPMMRRPDQAGLDHPAETAFRVGATRGRQTEREQQDRQREDHVGGARDERVDLAPVETGGHAEDHADHERQPRARRTR